MQKSRTHRHYISEGEVADESTRKMVNKEQNSYNGRWKERKRAKTSGTARWYYVFTIILRQLVENRGTGG